MESPLLTESGERNVEVTVTSDSSPNDQHIVVAVTDHADSSPIAEAKDGGPACYPCIQVKIWNLIKLVVTLVQVFAAILVLTLTKVEQQPEKVYITLVIGYTCGCFVTLPCLCWCVWHKNISVSSDSDTRIHKLIENFKDMTEYLFVGWVVVFSWHLFDHSSSLDYTIPHIWLCLAFLVISLVLHVVPNYNCAFFCFLLPMIGRFMPVFDYMDEIEGGLKYVGLVIGVIVVAIALCCGILKCIIVIVERCL